MKSFLASGTLPHAARRDVGSLLLKYPITNHLNLESGNPSIAVAFRVGDDNFSR